MDCVNSEGRRNEAENKSFNSLNYDGLTADHTKIGQVLMKRCLEDLIMHV